MKIATWNVERLKHFRQLSEIEKACYEVNADILVLTETDVRLQLDYRYAYHTTLLSDGHANQYKPTENRVTVFSNYPCLLSHKTYDLQTSLCLELRTEKGNILVYGTIMGIYGNRHPSFKEDLEKQILDIKRLTSLGKPVCIAGDYNLSFCDNWYFTVFGRNALLHSFNEDHIRLLTSERTECIDHIAVTEGFVGDSDIIIEEWNMDKRLSDHKGIAVSF